MEDFADAQVARESLSEVEAGGIPLSAEGVWAELGIESQAEIEGPRRDLASVRAEVRAEGTARCGSSTEP